MPDTIVERTDSGSSSGMIVGIVVVLLVALMVAFFVFGGPGRVSGPAPAGQTNVNVPGQQAQPQAPSAPNIQVPRQIDVNVNNQGGGQQAPAPGN